MESLEGTVSYQGYTLLNLVTSPLTHHAMSTRLQRRIKVHVVMRRELSCWKRASPVGHGPVWVFHATAGSIDVW